MFKHYLNCHDLNRRAGLRRSRPSGRRSGPRPGRPPTTSVGKSTRPPRHGFHSDASPPPGSVLLPPWGTSRMWRGEQIPHENDRLFPRTKHNEGWQVNPQPGISGRWHLWKTPREWDNGCSVVRVPSPTQNSCRTWAVRMGRRCSPGRGEEIRREAMSHAWGRDTPA